jgi:hypothetical protein
MRVLGLLIATGGGVAIGFGWAGAAQVDCVECQIPFLLSGGAAGIGLIIFGVALMLLAQIRTESRRLGDRIEHALGLRARPEDQHRPPAAATEPATREEPAAASPITEPRREDAAATGVTTEPRADAATLAATTMAGGVVDAEGDGGDAGAATPVEDQRSGDVSVPAPQGEQSPEALGRRSEPERRRGLFRRRKGQ